MKRAIKPNRIETTKEPTKNENIPTPNSKPANLLAEFKKVLVETRGLEEKVQPSNNNIALPDKESTTKVAEVIPLRNRSKLTHKGSKPTFSEEAEHLTLAEFRTQLKETSDLGKLLEAAQVTKQLKADVHEHIKKVLGITTKASVSFNIVTTTYLTKAGNQRIYYSLKASWNEKGKTKSKTFSL